MISLRRAKWALYVTALGTLLQVGACQLPGITGSLGSSAADNAAVLQSFVQDLAREMLAAWLV